MIKNLILQFSKFAVVGFVNTALDFGVLNVLIFATGVRGGAYLILLNSISFSIATANSYFWNKYWTFKKKDSVKVVEIGQFLTVSLIGLAINSGIVYLISTHISPMFGFSPGLWVNLAKVAATGASLIWNFVGYKFLVFKD
jgi:putative flippase GtrA